MDPLVLLCSIQPFSSVLQGISKNGEKLCKFLCIYLESERLNDQITLCMLGNFHDLSSAKFLQNQLF